MRFKTSCFNGTLCRNYLKRFWPLPLVVLGVTLLALGLPLAGQLREYNPVGVRLMNLLESIYGAAYIMVVLEAGAAFLAAGLVFHHLHSRREIQFYQALPLKRRCFYTTSYLTGFGLLAVPMLLGILICMGMVAAGGAGEAALALLKLYGVGIAALLLFYSMAVLACCLAGQTLGAVLIYAGMNCAVLVIIGCAGSIAATFMPGIDFDNFLSTFREWLTPLPKLFTAIGTEYENQSLTELYNNAPTQVEVSYPIGFLQPGVITAYGLVGAVLAVLSGLLYQIRPSEAAGEMVAFGPVRVLCKIFGALMVCVAGALVFLSSGLFTEEIPFAAVVLAVLGFGALGWFAAEMVVRKTLRVFGKKNLAACGMLLAVLLLLIAGGKLDLFGVVRRVPDADKVAAAEVNYNYGNSVEVTPQEAAVLHQRVLDNPMYLTNNTFVGPSISLQFVYTLDSGRQIYREYHVQNSYNSIVQSANTLLEQPEYCYQTWFGPLEDGVTAYSFQYGSISSYNKSRTEEYIPYLSNADPEWHEDYMSLTASQAVAIYEAVCQDIQNGNMLPKGFDEFLNSGPIGEIDMGCCIRDYDADRETYSEYAENTLTAYIVLDLSWSMEHTIACLEEMGFQFAGR